MTREFLEVGERGALICGDGPYTERLREILEGMEFTCHVAASPEQAIERMTVTTYDAICVALDSGESSGPESSAILRHLSLLPMLQRRSAYTVLIGDAVRTLDAMQAFGHSVHLVLNAADIGSIGPILKKGVAEFDRLYTTYRSVVNDELQPSHERPVR